MRRRVSSLAIGARLQVASCKGSFTVGLRVAKDPRRLGGCHYMGFATAILAAAAKIVASLITDVSLTVAQKRLTLSCNIK